MAPILSESHSLYARGRVYCGMKRSSLIVITILTIIVGFSGGVIAADVSPEILEDGANPDSNGDNSRDNLSVASGSLETNVTNERYNRGIDCNANNLYVNDTQNWGFDDYTLTLRFAFENFDNGREVFTARDSTTGNINFALSVFDSTFRFTLDDGSGPENFEFGDPEPGINYSISVQRDADSSIEIWQNQSKEIDQSLSFSSVDGDDIDLVVCGESDSDGTIPDAEIYEWRIWESLIDDQDMLDIADPNANKFNASLEGSERAAWFYEDGVTISDSTAGAVDSDLSHQFPTDNLKGIAASYDTSQNLLLAVGQSDRNVNGQNRLWITDHRLSIDNTLDQCNAPNLVNQTGTTTVDVTYDSQIIANCGHGADDTNALAVYTQTGISGFQAFQNSDCAANRAQLPEAITLNTVIWESCNSAFQSDFTQDSVVKRNIDQSITDVEVDKHPNDGRSWVGLSTFDNDDIQIFDSFGGVQLIENTTTGVDVIEVVNATLFGLDADNNEFKKFNITNASFLEEEATLTIPGDVGPLESSPDGHYLMAESDNQEEVIVIDGENMTDLLRLGTNPDPQDWVMDRCNNFVFVHADNGNSNATVERFDVAANTSSRAGNDTQLNSCPTNEFTRQTSGTLNNVVEAGTGQNEDALFGQDNLLGAAQAIGVTTDKMRIFLAGLLIIGMAAAFAAMAAETGGDGVTAAGVGAFGGLVISFGLGLVPVWFLVILALLGVIWLLFVRGSGGGNG